MMNHHPHFQKLVLKARQEAPLAAAVVYPCDRDALQLALSGEFAGYLAPTLVGPEARIRDFAGKAGLNISRLPIVDTKDDPRAAALRAIELARDGQTEALIKGGLGIEELLTPVASPDSGLRTETRLTHAFFLDLPGLDRGLLLADAQLNVNPPLAAKRDIVQNTVYLATALGVAAPRVGLLAAIDGASPAFPSTTDALALKEMAAQGVINGAIVDGPFTPESALSVEAAQSNGVKSGIAGQVDIMIAPGMEAALMVLKTLTVITRGLAAGLVLGAKVPIVVPARTDSMEVRIASCVLASLAAARQRASNQLTRAGAKLGEATAPAAA
ncbi:MAG: bifunctional enoyl-CoA hydratase/phosphate acetyltransferase [Betaproteobacteria bacterium]|nr:MAG: bifunctional enoyl-CoA hydratase/phosphate acetyltransferase [Betaproteobacteria bacterium]